MDRLTQDADRAFEAHRAAGRPFTAAGVASVALDQGEGPPVVLVHGLPMSSYLYRRVLPGLADRGLRGIAFDLPGLGLADRPADFDYRIAGLGAWSAAAVDALGLDGFHLVVHDAGGPVGFELAARMPGRLRSLTILNTALDLGRMPFPGEMVAKFAGSFGERVVTPDLWRRMIHRVGIENRRAVPKAEIEVHRRLCMGDNGGATYLAIMRHLRDTHDPARWAAVVDSRTAGYPVQVVWGGHDPMLTLRRFGWPLLEATGLPWMRVLPGKHYLQEDNGPEVARLIADHAHRAEAGAGA